MAGLVPAISINQRKELTMRFLRKIGGALVGALFAAGVIASTILPAFALTVPQQFAPTLFQTQQTHYIRATVSFNSCVYVSLVCSVKLGALPYNAFLVRGYAQTTTAWNAGTSASIGLGTVTPAVNIMASTASTSLGASGAVAITIVSANVGLAVTGNGIAQTGANGGFDLWATITIVGALPTAGQTTIVLEFIAPNDGSCTQVPMNTTAPAC